MEEVVPSLETIARWRQNQDHGLRTADSFVLHSVIMKLRDGLTRKKIIIASSILVVGLLVAGFFALRRPPRVAMDRFVPNDSLAFVEINSLTDLVDGLTSTRAWRELAPVLGLSSQLRQVGFAADLIGRTGLGPDEAVVTARAQYAIAITGIESRAGETEDGPYLHLKPDFALIIETHSNPETASRLVSQRALLIAQRIYGESIVEQPDDYRGSRLLVFHGPDSARQLVATSSGSLILIGNQSDAIKLCLDTIAGRTASLAEDSTLKEKRPELGRDPSVFAYLTPKGIEKLVDVWPVLIAGRGPDPETLSMFADLAAHISKQAGAGMLYSSRFADGGVTEEYLTVLRPRIAEALSESLKSVSQAGFPSLGMIPRRIDSLVLLNVEGAGESPERVLKQLSPNVDVVAGVALREFVIGFREQYGLAPGDSAGDATGSEIAVVNCGDGQPRVMLVRVNDRSRLAPIVNRYLTRKAAAITAEQDNGIEVLVSSNEDRRAAAFVGDYLVLGTRDQIGMMIATQAGRDGIDGDERLKQVLAERPSAASIISYRPRVEDAGKLVLGIARLMRVNDGSQELLERDDARKALDRLPPSISFTEFRSYGVYTRTHSAAGSFGSIASLVGSADEQ